MKEEEDDASSETQLSLSLSPSSSSPNHLVLRTDIVTKVEADTAKEEKTEKENGSAL